MAFGESASLLFKIRGDPSDAVNAFQQVKREGKDLASDLGKTGAGAGSLSGAFTSLAGPAALAAAGVAAIGAAAIAGGLALFNLTKTASDFGSEIFDASEKTGLSAEKLSAMKFAADQSGTSLDSVTGAASRFAKVIGEAANGSEKAQAKLDRLGVTSKDLDEALGQALATIVKMPAGTQQMNAAIDAFGKSGTDLLPFIKSFDGDLEALTKTAKELGVTIDDETARAADEFGDQMDTLGAQLAGVGRLIGMELMPVFLEMARDISGWLKENKGQVSSWARAFADQINIAVAAVKQLILYNEILANTVDINMSTENVGKRRIQIDAELAHLERVRTGVKYETLEDGRRIGGEGREKVNPYFDDDDRAAAGNKPKAPNVVNIRGEGSEGGDFNRADRKWKKEQAEEESAELTKIEQQRVADARRYYQNETEYFAAEVKVRIALSNQAVATGKKTAEDAARFAEDQERIVTDNKRKYLAEYLAALKSGTDEYIRVEQELRIMDEEIAARKIELDTNEINRIKEKTEEEKKLRQERNDSFNDYVQNLIRKQELEDAERDRKAMEALESAEAGDGTFRGGLGQGMGVQTPSIFGKDGEGKNKIKTEAEFMKDVYADMANSAGRAVGQMVSGLANLALQWAITGKFSAKAALQMVAGIAMGLAQEAVMKALMEVAHGMAAIARLDPVSASAHFAAAKFYGVVAAVAGGTGIALGLASRAAGGGGSGRGGSQAFAGQTGQENNRNVAGQGGNYSSQQDTIIEQGRNSPFDRQQNRIEVIFRDRSGWFAEMFETEVKKGGKVREVIRDTAGDS